MVGWGAVNWLSGLQQNTPGSSGTSSSSSTRSWDKLPTGQYKSTIFGAYSSERDELSEEEVEEREQAAQVQQELKQFDEILARKERQQRQQKQRYYDRDIEIK
jgi:hypothetical protein